MISVENFYDFTLYLEHKVGYKGKPGRLERTLNFPERSSLSSTNHGQATLDNEPKATPLSFLYLALKLVLALFCPLQRLFDCTFQYKSCTETTRLDRFILMPSMN